VSVVVARLTLGGFCEGLWAGLGFSLVSESEIGSLRSGLRPNLRLPISSRFAPFVEPSGFKSRAETSVRKKSSHSQGAVDIKGGGESGIRTRGTNPYGSGSFAIVRNSLINNNKFHFELV